MNDTLPPYRVPIMVNINILLTMVGYQLTYETMNSGCSI